VVTARAQALVARWGATAVSVTLSGRGALVVGADPSAPPLVVPAPRVPCPDPCGAGDRFASTAAGVLADGGLPTEAVSAAVHAASAFVAAGGAASVRVGAPAAPAAEVLSSRAVDVIARVRAAGGTVVATGGCFDLLHAGHVSVLQQARALGDCLVVLLNSDDSVRRLKGPERPVRTEAERAYVLAAFAAVDAVVVFGEDTPLETIRALTPDVIVKGGDYSEATIVGAAETRSRGGDVVVIPLTPGQSTTGIIAKLRAHHRA
jgi:rfaE bifunctional protein nucleotidyltransferase chain/domain